jgi:hypothetical protein
MALKELQARLDKLIGMPSNLPVIYLLGDTGAGKTCVVRQLLGTTNQSFPSVRRLRTTVAPTDFIITSEPELAAAFVFKTEPEISRFVREILEEAVLASLRAIEDEDNGLDLADVLANSPDERFRLSCFLSEKERRELGQRIMSDLAPRIHSWVLSNFPKEEDRSTAIALAVENEFSPDLEHIEKAILGSIRAQVNAACAAPPDQPIPATFLFRSVDKLEFVARLKTFLSVEQGSISPVIEKARVRGMLRSALLPPGAELVVIDGEGIGHDVRESRTLSARHLEYFYLSDGIVLVEDSETPFKAGGKSALAGIAKNGYLPKLSLAFSRLDKVQAEKEGRIFQQREVDKSLRNALHALKDDGVLIEKRDLDVRYLANMDKDLPDDETQHEIKSLLEATIKKHAKAKARFVAPVYDFELLAAFLTEATAALRAAWEGYIRGQGTKAAPWQTQKAFTFRMDWKEDEYRFLKPVAEFADLLVSKLSPFLSKPIGWTEEITQAHKKDCLGRLSREFSHRVLELVRSEVLEDEHPQWTGAAKLHGPGSTFDRRRVIMEAIYASAPQLTGADAKKFKDAVKSVIESALGACARDAG